MPEYRKKPVVIEAFKLGVDYIPDWFMDAVTKNNVILRCDYKGETSADIETLEGWHHANYGDYIIRGVKGELYPCKADIFDMTYEVADKLKTNADRIRAMSDEKLAKLFMEFAVKCYDDCGVSAEIITTDYVMEWLKQPAAEV